MYLNQNVSLMLLSAAAASVFEDGNDFAPTAELHTGNQSPYLVNAAEALPMV